MKLLFQQRGNKKKKIPTPCLVSNSSRPSMNRLPQVAFKATVYTSTSQNDRVMVITRVITL
jgi:hypothetical protein